MRAILQGKLCAIRASAVLLLLMSSSVVAAPFCAVSAFGKQCIYFSYDACMAAVGTSGACVINQEEARRPSGGAPFCVVTGFGTQCWYYDAESCRPAAAGSGGACAVNPNR